jgi:Domain of unknown function (DUF4411)
LIYCIDTSALIDGWRDFYPPDVFPALWQDIEELIEAGVLISCEEVKTELAIGDSLDDWASNRPNMFLPLDADTQLALASILSHPEHRKLVKPQATKTDADPFVIATAQVKNCTVVSNEKLRSSPSPTKNWIPNVCRDLGIRHLSFLELIRERGWIYKR